MKRLRFLLVLGLLLAVGGPATVAVAASGAEGAGHASVDPNPLTFDPDLAIVTLVIFLLLLAILWKFAWGPIAVGLAKREQSIADNIDAAEEAASEARRLTANYEGKLASAADEVRQMIDEARRDAEHTRQQILEEAQQSAVKERDRTLREIDVARETALKEIADRGADLAVDLAGKITRRELSAQDHTRLINESVREFLERGPSNN